MAKYHYEVEVIVEATDAAIAEDVVIQLMESKGFTVATGIKGGSLTLIAW